MKSDTNLTLNKLLSYAFDNLLLDTLDETYTLNRLAAVCGIAEPKRIEDADYGEQTLAELLDELAATLPAVDKATVADVLFPMPRTVNYYLNGELDRSTEKGIAFLFDLYTHGYDCLSASDAMGKNGYLAYSESTPRPVTAAALFVGENLVYTPRVIGNHIATLENPDILSDDILAREAEYVSKFGGAIATVVGKGTDYRCCDAIALTNAGVKQKISDGTVKISLLGYPVPALAFNGIAKNAVQREAARVIKAAVDAGLSPVVAAAAKDGITFYLVFANDVADGEIIKTGTALAACGIFRTIDCSPLLSVLEKGTALSTDLAPFKKIYDVIGGVKLGAKAKAELGGALVDMFIPALAASAATTEQTAVGLVAPQQ